MAGEHCKRIPDTRPDLQIFQTYKVMPNVQRTRVQARVQRTCCLHLIAKEHPIAVLFLFFVTKGIGSFPCTQERRGAQ